MKDREIIAILRGVRPDEVVDIATAILDAGITRIEVPLNSPDPFDSIGKLSAAMGLRALIGAGTVLTTEDAARVASVGGQMVVSPDCNTDVIEATKRTGMVSFPGVMTPSECFRALRHGADGLKVFPASVLGISGLKALRAVLPRSAKVYTVGGASSENFGEWIRAGATGFGIGTAIYQPGDTSEDVSGKAIKIVRAYDEAR
ncbi:2-dehydro-3-deoxy-6-phosphogalactonate aldolase [Aliiruegeria lutimaris]|uniref:2-keto-3-deoxy-phosphogalactonate aldolase n=1 Tax=Aliiruegeria lutimaris TaxID=571298 RepID=A0A1G9GLA7_9RHOB|nr:2-dehydro-3-deoxy-6-phosphogalactonate aldolase [Aliiruegeria lutimaris]SDL01437.1 2-keto-3-deoxy-phosphogalactonate aldolase [Aliiruegeria lutimaris]